MLTPTKLRCEYRCNPLGIDQTWPRFDWQLQSDKPEIRGQTQSAYQILVASSEANLQKDVGDLWNSGPVKSDQTSQICYAGKMLGSGQRAFWKVKSWDGNGTPGDWSTPAKFSTGLLTPSDWQARWIGLGIGLDSPAGDTIDPATVNGNTPANEITPAISLDGLSWIWFPDKPVSTQPATANASDPFAGTFIAPGSYPAGSRFFRKIINIPQGKLASVTLLIAADDRFELFVNGSAAVYGGDFHKAWPADITHLMHPGANLIAISVRNDKPGPAGLIGRFRIKMANQLSTTLNIDTTWLVANEKIADWESELVTPEPGKWITAQAVAKHGDQPWGKPVARTLVLPPARYLRKEFTIEKPIANATLYVSALGLYEAHLNGHRVGSDLLTPGWTEYTKRVHYQTYDVTRNLKQGENALGAILGDGWYTGYFGFTGKRNNYGGSEPRFLAQLNVDYTDGTSEIFATDKFWKGTAGPLREADLLMGCTYDANQELGAWDSPGFNDAKWRDVSLGTNAAHLEASAGDTVRRIEELPAKKITQPLPNTYVFDIGQNMVGWVRLKLATKPDQTIVLRYSEMLNPDGTLYTPSLRAARATDTYMSKGGEIVWEPTFTFHGFRYVEITGVDEQPSLDTITGVVVHSQMDRAGDFECSNPLVNKLVHNIIWGQKGNYLEVPTDCPQRDERLGWTGDAQFFIPTGAYNFDIAAFFSKWLVDLCEDSADEKGAFASVAPDVPILDHGATAWADAGIICPYNVYKFYGDTRVIIDHYPAMTKYINYLHETSTDLIRGQGAYGDWLNLGGGAKSEVIGTAYFEHVVRLMSEMSAAVGKTEDAKKYRALADQIRVAFIKEFIAADGTIKESSQTGYALAFAFDLIPADLREKAGNAFVAEIEKKNWHLATGFIGTPRLLPALSLAQKYDVAYRLLQQEEFPGWLFQVKLGATTMWERWDGWTPDKGFQDPGMNSFNHYAFGSVGEWLYRTAGGIDTQGSGFKQIMIDPQPGGNLSFAKTSYNSIHGKIESSWKIEGDTLTLDVTIPLNTHATIVVPTSDPSSITEAGGLKASPDRPAVYKVGSGRYQFTAKR